LECTGDAFVSRKYAARHCGRDDRELIEAGFKVLVKKFHPDMGGRTQKMRGLNAVMGKLPKTQKEDDMDEALHRLGPYVRTTQPSRTRRSSMKLF